MSSTNALHEHQVVHYSAIQTKCVQYWPTGRHAKFGDIGVTVDEEVHLAHYIKRKMTSPHR